VEGTHEAGKCACAHINVAFALTDPWRECRADLGADLKGGEVQGSMSVRDSQGREHYQD